MGELVEGPAWNLEHTVVQGGLECGRGLFRNGILDLVQFLAHRYLGRHPGYGIAGGLAGQSRTATDSGVNLDHEIRRAWVPFLTQSFGYAWMGLHGKLDVATALNAQSADDLEACRAQHLVFLVAQRLARSHHDAVAGVNAHGVQVFHVADGDAIVGAIPHHLVLNLFPANQRAFQQDLGDRAGRQAGTGEAFEFFFGVGDTATAAAQCVGGPHYQWKAHPFGNGPGLFHGVYAFVLGLGFIDLV